MKHEYLIELLKQNKTVILPNIGAFSNNTNPQHPFLFNEFLKFNDGMVAKHIASKEGISMDVAGETIDKFTQELKQYLEAGQEVVIPGIGTLVKKDGKTILTHGHSSTSTPVVEKKIEPVIEKKIEPIIEKPVEPKVEIKPEPKIEPVIVPVIEKKIEPITEKKIDPIIEKKIEPVVETKIEPSVEKKVEPIIEKIPEPILEKKTEPISDKKTEIIPPKVEVKKVSEQNNEKPKKKKRRWVWILLLLLLLGGGTAGFLFKDDLMKMMGMGAEEKSAENKSEEKDDNEEESEKSESENSTEENTVTPEPVAEDTTSTEMAPVEETTETPKEEIKVEQVVEENKTAPLSVESATPGNYYIIVGCFQEPTNADKMLAKVSSSGLTPTNVGTFNSLAHIAAGSAGDLQTAIQLAGTIRATFPKVWILKR